MTKKALFLWFAGAFATFATGLSLLLPRLAHADPVATPQIASFDWTFWIAVTAFALAALSAVLHAVAPRTKNTVDDRLRDEVDVLRGMIRGLIPATGVPTVTSEVATAPATPSTIPSVVGLAPVGGGGGAGATATISIARSSTTGMLAILVLGAALGAGAVSTAGCGGSQSSRAATISSLDSGVRAAIAALRSYEHTKAEAAIASARNLDEGRAALTALRTRTEPVWHAMEAAIAALDTASTINDDPSVKGAQKALNDALAAYSNLTGGTP